MLKEFGLSGRWSRDCHDTGANNGWTIYDIPKDGPVTAEGYRGGDSAATLRFRDLVLSAEVLPDDQLRISSRIEFPLGLEDKRVLVLKRVGGQIRNMQVSVTQLDKVIDRIKDGVFVLTGKETPLLNHCDGDLPPVQ